MKARITTHTRISLKQEESVTPTHPASTSRRGRAALLVLLFTGIVVIAVVLVFALNGGQAAPPEPTPQIEGVTAVNPPIELANVTLTNQFGEQVALEDLEGKLALMFFGYTHCPDFCPATLDEFKRIREDLGDRAGDVQFVFVSVDGERDTPEVMRDYLAVRGVDDFVLGLTGPEDDVRALGQPLGVFFERNTSSGSAAGYLVDHSTHSFLLDRNGDVRVVYSFTTPPDVIADTIRPYL
ncbi:MAG: SCO family protein [Chloroflexota bacterium]